MKSDSPVVEIINNLRISVLTDSLVRIEERGPKGFEDRPSFTVLSRDAETTPATVETTDTEWRLKTDGFCITVPRDGQSIAGLRIETVGGRLLKKLSRNTPGRSEYPTPSSLPSVWIMADAPRVIPPAWGALPPPAASDHSYSGWDLENDAVDLYVFLPRLSGYQKFRKDFLALTGRIPMPPLYTFGFWYSRYHPYSEETALQVIDAFRAKGFPLDMFVVDTDWRVGASAGYSINTQLFPDMERFIRSAHERKVRVMFNDHPEPVGDHALSPEELAYRQEGLLSLLRLGADAWWFDRNWHTHLQSPAEGFNKEVWGMMLYHDMTQAFRPDRRPLIMSNVDGIDSGYFCYPSHPAAHRYPIWWTGDTVGTWDYLERGVTNGVASGINGLLPYVNEDMGGHHGEIDAEYFMRAVQYGALSPVTRLHCSSNLARYPWLYGESAEENARGYLCLRYRLLPALYTAAYRAWRNGTPLMRRCDLEWPQVPEASDNSQYLLGDDLLVAPILGAVDETGLAERRVWIPEGEWIDLWTGAVQAGPATVPVRAPVDHIPLFMRRGAVVVTAPQCYSTEDFSWSQLSVDAVLPVGDGRVTRTLYEDDGCSNAYLDGAFGLTYIELERCSHTAVLTTRPVGQTWSGPTGMREWTLRFHLPVGRQPNKLEINGEAADVRQLQLISETPVSLNTLFAGAGSPPIGAGSVVAELAITHSAARCLRVQLSF